MNRKQRRAGVKTGSTDCAPVMSRPASPASSLFSAALELHKRGRLTDAETLYRQALQQDPQHVDSLNFLGVLAQQTGRAEESVALIGKALKSAPRLPALHYNIAASLSALGKLQDAVTHYKRAIQFQPHHPGAYNNLGRILQQQEKFAEAASAYETALALAPDPRVLCNLGNLRALLGEYGPATQCYERALALNPNMAEAYNGLASTQLSQGKPSASITALRKALVLRSDFPEARANLARAFLGTGEPAAALDEICRSLALSDNLESQALFVACAKVAPPPVDRDPLVPLLRQALAEQWGRPADLALLASQIVATQKPLPRWIAQAEHAWPDRLTIQDFEIADLTELARTDLLSELLESTPICNRGLERLLTSVRSILLHTIRSIQTPSEYLSSTDDLLTFWCALAQQCFITEYVFDTLDTEIEHARELWNALATAIATEAPVSPLWPVAMAAYFPLARLPNAERLLDRAWPTPVATLLHRQVGEVLQEQRLQSTIPRLTSIAETSQSVRFQYENNPYPRWVAAGKPKTPVTIDAYLNKLFPGLGIRVPGRNGRHDVLVAGCGTGQQPIEVARMYKGVHVLAVDLSLASLAYAQRQTEALGITNVDYQQADILQLGRIDRKFDVIQASGVLHHLADPMLGWRTLLQILRPGGLMCLGLYSELARQDVVEARGLIAQQGLKAEPEDIRRFRQSMMEAAEGTSLWHLAHNTDFNSMSGCRDLLFHVQEHRLRLPEIEAFLTDNGLAFLGFDLPAPALHFYRSQFPGDPGMTNLQNWNSFEHARPTTFRGMYQFWVQSAR